MNEKILIKKAQVSEFCHKWKITEFAIFGSALREDYKPESDLDIVVTFAPDIPWSLWDWIDMIDELKIMFGREVDLVEKSGIKNPFRRQEILSQRQVIYET
jgi:hypothetical protein